MIRLKFVTADVRKIHIRKVEGWRCSKGEIATADASRWLWTAPAAVGGGATLLAGRDGCCRRRRWLMLLGGCGQRWWEYAGDCDGRNVVL
ncbi:hypothetical protein E3N88_15198 [Mikania micrantha]|uniref:Uncharacterized protein n=1 Tax=Mikania micrantha TaxID=192012 RepID=A0A5N6NW79_9ASTR|nr:hypothetical protein E3N88_15198 [Mikania micrantha]